METDKRCTLHPNGKVALTYTPQLKHHGRWDCTDCGKFVVWAKSPKTCEEMEDRQDTIMNIIKSKAAELSDRDLKDLLKLYSVTHLTLVQDQTWRGLKTIKY
jgi:hypothetical protein